MMIASFITTRGTTEIRVAHTCELPAADLAASRDLLFRVFAVGEGNVDWMTDDDWDHALGGMHVIVKDKSGVVIGHGAVVQRHMMIGHTVLRTGYVEGLGVSSEWRRMGIASAIMQEIENIIVRSHAMGALSASEDAFALYESRGWKLWQGPLQALSPEGIIPTPDEQGCIFVFAGSTTDSSSDVDVTAILTCDWRRSDVW